MIIGSIFPIFAQDDKVDNITFEEAPVITERPTYFGIGLGYLGTFIFPSYADLNTKIKTDFSANPLTTIPQYKNPVYLSGAHGFTGIGIIPNIRVGFFGYSGTNSVTKANLDTTTGSSIKIGMTGLSIDYGIVLFKSFAILPGVSFGLATVDLEFYKANSSYNWGDVTDPPKQGGYMQRMEGSFYFVQPNVNFEYAVKPYLMIRGDIGYSLSFSPTWKYNTNATLNNVPSGINSSGLTLQLGVFVGLFNF